MSCCRIYQNPNEVVYRVANTRSTFSSAVESEVKFQILFDCNFCGIIERCRLNDAMQFDFSFFVQFVCTHKTFQNSWTWKCQPSHKCGVTRSNKTIPLVPIHAKVIKTVVESIISLLLFLFSLRLDIQKLLKEVRPGRRIAKILIISKTKYVSLFISKGYKQVLMISSRTTSFSDNQQSVRTNILLPTNHKTCKKNILMIKSYQALW